MKLFIGTGTDFNFLIQGVITYTYICITYYGEEKLFHNAALKDTDVGFYLRNETIR